MESLPNKSVQEDNKFQASNSPTNSDKQTLVRNDSVDKIVIDSNVLIDSLNNYVCEDCNIENEDSDISNTSDEHLLMRSESEDKTDLVSLLPLESTKADFHSSNFKNKDSDVSTGLDHKSVIVNELEREILSEDYLVAKLSLKNCLVTNIARSTSSDSFIFTECNKEALEINDFKDKITTEGDLNVETLNNQEYENNYNVESSSSNRAEEQTLVISDFEGETSVNDFNLSTNQPFDNVHEESLSDNSSSSAKCNDKHTPISNDSKVSTLPTPNYDLSFDLPSTSFGHYDDNFESIDQKNFIDPLNVIMHCRSEISELSEKCISKIMLQKEEASAKYGMQYPKTIKLRLENLSLQQNQLESIISDTNVQLSSAFISNPENIIKSSKIIIKNFDYQCRLFESFYPSFAFKDDVLSALENNQVVIISADSYYCFNIVLPIFIKTKYPETPLICCESCEFNRSWLQNCLINFLGKRIVTNSSYKKHTKNKVLCLTEEEMLESFSDIQHLFQQGISVVNIPLIRTVTCDILMSHYKDMLKVNKKSKLILLVPSYSEVLDYKKYFFKLVSVSILKPKSLSFPVTTVWKNNQLTLDNYYIEEVVQTILSILVLKEHGDILAFLPQFEELEHAAELLNSQLLQLKFENIQSVLIYENAICDLNSLNSFIKLTDIRRIFLSTNCAEALFLPTVQHVVDCGIKNVYVYDPFVKTDMLDTVFISSKNANLRKFIAGAQHSGFCYRIYNKNNFQKDMLKKDLPEVLMVCPLNTMLKLLQYKPNNAINSTFIESVSDKMKHDALNMLQVCGAVENNLMTHLGENIAKLPFDPNYSKLILLALEQALAFEVIVLVSFFTSKENIFLYSSDRNQQRLIDTVKLQLTQNDSDSMSYLHIYKIGMDTHFSQEFCDKHFINYGAMQNIYNNVMDMLSIVNSCLEVDITHNFSDITDSYANVTKLLFACFQNNLCVFSGYMGSGYKVLQSSSLAFIHSSSLIHQWEALPQFIIYDRLHFTSKDLVHVTSIPDDIIMDFLSNGTTKYNFEDLFEQILIKRIIEPIGEELINELTKGGKNEQLKIIQNEVRNECGNDLIFIDISIKEGHVYIYALPNYVDNALCAVDDIIKNMLSEILNENRIEVLELKKGQNKVCIEVSWSKGGVASSLTICPQPPNSYGSKQTSNSVQDYVEDPIGVLYFLHFSWIRRYCNGEGYVTFKDNVSFLEARKLGMRHVKILGTEVFVQLSDKDKFQVLLTGLPLQTRCKNLEKELRLLLPNSKIINIELKYKKPFETSNEDIEKIRAIITMKCIEYDLLDQCDIVIPKPDAEDLDMVSYIYTYNNDILDFVANVLSTEFIQNKEIISDVRYKVHVNCSPEICTALEPCFKTELAQLEFGLETQPYKANLDFDLYIDKETKDKAILKLSSGSKESLILLHRTINNLLEGEILSSKTVNGLENLFFYGGYLWLRNLEKTENLYILEDSNKKEVRLYGSLDSCYNARSQIIAFLEDAENDIMLPIPLFSESKSSLLLKAIIKEYGINLEALVESSGLRSALLDIKARQLLLRGNREAVTKAEDTIKILTEGLDLMNIVSGQSQEICPVCACPASNLSFRLEYCGHLYCVECIQALVEQAQFPVCCCAEKCSKDIVLKDIKKVLKDDSEKIKTLVEKSMKDYLERNRVTIAYCPVADCSMFFNKTEISGNRVNCCLCQNEICISCNVLYHGGYTCEMYQNSKKDPDFSFKVWQKTNSKCKQCPRCKTAIEKIEGCNRMLCTSCKGRFCWICVKEFPTDQAVYNHIHANHTGMLFAQV